MLNHMRIFLGIALAWSSATGLGFEPEPLLPETDDHQWVADSMVFTSGPVTGLLATSEGHPMAGMSATIAPTVMTVKSPGWTSKHLSKKEVEDERRRQLVLLRVQIQGKRYIATNGAREDFDLKKVFLKLKLKSKPAKKTFLRRYFLNLNRRDYTKLRTN